MYLRFSNATFTNPYPYTLENVKVVFNSYKLIFQKILFGQVTSLLCYIEKYFMHLIIHVILHNNFRKLKLNLTNWIFLNAIR